LITDLKKVVENWGLQDRLQVQEEIQLCHRCSGAGEIEERTMADYHKGLYETTFRPCDECNSTGRIYKQTLNLTGFRPFKEAGDGN